MHICIFAFKFTLKCLQPDIVPIMSLTSVVICHRCQQLELVAKFAAGVDIGVKFPSGVVETGGNFATSVIDTGGAP